MAQKTIPELTTRPGGFDTNCLFPVDDGTQTFKITFAQFMTAFKTVLAPLYGAVVDAAGSGSYTTLAAAIAASEKKIRIISDLTISAAVTVPSGTIIEGPGWGKKITFDTTGKLVLAGKCVIKDIGLYTALTSGSYAMIETSGNYNRISNCELTVPSGGTSKCINWINNGNHVEDSHFIGTASPSTGIGIDDDGSDNTEDDNVSST